MYLLGYDLGSSSVKASLVNAESGKIAASAFFPKKEMEIISVRSGWAEQDPETWWQNLKLATKAVMKDANIHAGQIAAIGISWQMHGLVCIDKNHKVLRPAIIWCDSRAVTYGEKALQALGKEYCLSHLLNSPGNFTAAKLAWVKENEPQIYEQIDKIMLPGDYLAMRLSGNVSVTIEGLSEGIMWDFKKKQVSDDILNFFGFPKNIIPEITPIFGIQAKVSAAVAAELGLNEGTPIAYRAGDQPNNALSLNVFNAGEIAATAGTSGVVYGVLDKLDYDRKSRVNTFAHVNYDPNKDLRLGVLLCINGTGILNSWLKRNLALEGVSYSQMNDLAMQSPIGAGGISILPFGNGAERVLENREIGCQIHGLNFNTHSKNDILRAAQEGIVFSFKYGMEIMQTMGMNTKLIRAGHANMFLSKLFTQTLANVSGATIELLDTDGAAGAARGAGIGIGYYKDNNEAFANLTKLQIIEPNTTETEATEDAYNKWKNVLGE